MHLTLLLYPLLISWYPPLINEVSFSNYRTRRSFIFLIHVPISKRLIFGMGVLREKIASILSTRLNMIKGKERTYSTQFHVYGIQIRCF